MARISLLWQLALLSGCILMGTDGWPSNSTAAKSFKLSHGDKQNSVSKHVDDKLSEKQETLRNIEMKLDDARSSRKKGTCTHQTLNNVQLNPEVTGQFYAQRQIALHSANILNNLFLSPTGDRHVSRDFYQRLAAASVDTDATIVSSGIAFARGRVPQAASSELVGIYVYRSGKELVNGKDLASLFNNSYDVNGTNGSEWYWKLANTVSEKLSEEPGGGSEGIVEETAALNSSGTNAGMRIVLTEADDGIWTSPFLDCSATEDWVFAFAAPFFERRNSRTEFKGSVFVAMALGELELDQCNASHPLGFGGTHKCDPLSTICVSVSGTSFQPGGYKCTCRPGFFFPERNATNKEFLGRDVEDAYNRYGVLPSKFKCSPCPVDCTGCGDNGSCIAQQDLFLRSLPLGIQALCMTVTVILALVVFQLRKSKVMASAMWTMLEMILLGAFLLYATVMVSYFEPTQGLCLLAPWCRELGFAICYGAIILKMYRTLVEFRTRKAHRWVIKDKDLLKYLSGVIVIVTGYMAAWTASTLDFVRDGHKVLTEGRTPQGDRYGVCRPIWWDYVTETSELLLMLFGVYLSYHIRNANSLFHEKRCLCLAIYVEAIVSFIYYILRYIYWLSMHPDLLFIMEFVRGQATTTLVLLFIFIPKLWYHYRPPHSDRHGRNLSTTEMGERGGSGAGSGASGSGAAVGSSQVGTTDGLKFPDGVALNGEVDVAEINIAQMDPEDIRAELKRVYTQLQVLRDKTMRKDNPHISKRRGGRKATHRRFSLQVTAASLR